MKRAGERLRLEPGSSQALKLFLILVHLVPSLPLLMLPLPGWF
ncbi:hypothetical protein [Solemya velesiana gill symbiont]|nr:hypothetical protein [Solemya velesiana gill symbiont]